MGKIPKDSVSVHDVLSQNDLRKDLDTSALYKLQQAPSPSSGTGSTDKSFSLSFLMSAGFAP